MENLADLGDAQQGRIDPKNVRRVTVTDALVDTGATMLSLPRNVMRRKTKGPTKGRKDRHFLIGSKWRCLETACLECLSAATDWRGACETQEAWGDGSPMRIQNGGNSIGFE